MAVIQGGTIIEGSVGMRTTAGAPSAGTNEVQTLSISGTPTGGTFTLTFDGFTTAAIARNAAAAAVQSALLALPNLDSGDVVASGGALPGTPVVLTFGGNYARMPVNLITANGALLTGGTSPTAAVAETTPGVKATERGAAKGTILTDTTNAVVYVNTGTELAPTWTVVGTQA